MTTKAENRLFLAHCFALQLSARRRARKREVGDPGRDTTPTAASGDDARPTPAAMQMEPKKKIQM